MRTNDSFIRRRLQFGLLLAVAIFVAACGAILTTICSKEGACNAGSTADLYQHRCGSCHSPFPAHSYSDSEWKVVIRKMTPPADLTPEESSRILTWLQENN